MTVNRTDRLLDRTQLFEKGAAFYRLFWQRKVVTDGYRSCPSLDLPPTAVRTLNSTMHAQCLTTGSSVSQCSSEQIRTLSGHRFPYLSNGKVSPRVM